jgi:hypothetical protein
MYGTLFWNAGGNPSFPLRLCEGIHSDIHEGLADVVVIAEPLDQAAKREVLAHRSRMITQQPEGYLQWSDSGIMVERVDPRAALTIANAELAERILKIRHGDQLVRDVIVPAGGEVEVKGLPEGILRVVAASQSRAEAWIYVTPWPSSVTGGNCRYSFELPLGRYRLRGWHPYAGERSMLVTVRPHRKVTPRSDLKFGVERQTAGRVPF